jgi:hypothetical protein
VQNLRAYSPRRAAPPHGSYRADRAVIDATIYKHAAIAVGIERALWLVMIEKSDELRDRIEARKHELLAKYNELKADSRHEAGEARTRLKARLDELELHLKAGWAKVNADVRTKLNHWLERKD